jgi:hypothetical protein
VLAKEAETPELNQVRRQLTQMKRIHHEADAVSDSTTSPFSPLPVGGLPAWKRQGQRKFTECKMKDDNAGRVGLTHKVE